MVCMWVLDILYSLLGNWLRDHTSWALSGIGVKIKSLPKNFWSLVLNFTTPRYAFLFSNSETYIAHVIYCKWSRSIIFPLCTCIFPIVSTMLMRTKALLRLLQLPWLNITKYTFYSTWIPFYSKRPNGRYAD